MKSVLTIPARHTHAFSLPALLAVVVAGIALLGVLASLTAPSVDHSCTSTPANRAFVQCAIHGN